ncbi:MAG: alanine/glycine:cation symporter family protein [Verrucomicrobiales bacterium]|jgi:AGCS family alanine or glycine:cation symporter|nr:alanine/glycine:cation symporter family protein [Verrucomicrobiales bacterium]
MTLQKLQDLATKLSALAWGPWLLVLLLGGGLYFLIYSKFAPFMFLSHAWKLVRGKFDDPDAPGHISHFKALSAALAGTIGMGNIAGVALAIVVGGPGTIFWMWVTAIIGTATKFFTCTLAVMYRGKDSAGVLQGGPMYVIREGLNRRWRWLAVLFSLAGLVGCLPAFQANQLVQIIRDVIFIENGWLPANDDYFVFNGTAGILISAFAAVVIFGGITRIANVSARIVPAMATLYVVTVIVALILNASDVPAAVTLIFTDAFEGNSVAGGAVLTVILYGVQRGAYSNEAGMGTESMAHGAAKTKEPVREGLVAMLGPIIDTLLICTATALAILVSGVWESSSNNGVTLTANALYALLGAPGLLVVVICTVCFSVTTILTYSFYGSQCASYLFGARNGSYYRWVFTGFIVISSVISLETAISLIDIAFALMAIPTMISSILLASKVKAAAEDYFSRLRS